ncbi:hypothetical protein MMC28_001172 [Mycoblastus sanguinarius]|nr:hypothetical protein [Mycoblastus sanguinarius]
MPARSLLQSASKACIKNIRSITDVGDTPYDLLRPILTKIDNPEQLRQIEIASPQICGPDGEIWLEMIKRDVPDWDQKLHEPKNPQNWFKVYQKLYSQGQKEIDKDAELLKRELDGIKKEQAKHIAKQVELNIVKVPEGMKSRGPPISLPRNSHFHDKNIFNHEAQHAPRRRVQSVRDPNSGRVTLTPKGKLEKFRKEAKAMGHFQKPGRPGTIRPQDMTLRPASTNKTIVPPRRLIEEHRKPAASQPLDPTVKPSTIFAPRKRRIEHDDLPASGASTTEEREKRLKAFTNTSNATEQVSTSSSTPPPHKKERVQSIEDEPSQSSIPPTKSSSPPRPMMRLSPAPGMRVPRANTSSPNSSGGSRPPMKLKPKAPVDVFMPAKRRRLF